MKLSNKHYGYPVLSEFSDDYVGNIAFTIDLNLNTEQDAFLIDINITLENEELWALITAGKAIFTIHFEESRTCFRKVYHFTNINEKIQFPVGEIKEKLEVVVFLTAKEEIKINKFTSLHKFYQAQEVNYEPYQMIGISNRIVVDITMEQDVIDETKSIFSIVPDKDSDAKYFKVDLLEERIVITMPEEDFKVYRRLLVRNTVQNIHSDILLSNIVMPIMVEVLTLLKDSQNMYDEKIWYRSLIAAYKEKGVNLEEEFTKDTFRPYYFSQVIFDSVISKSLNQVVFISEER